jgi:hypothetical protein
MARPQQEEQAAVTTGTERRDWLGSSREISLLPRANFACFAPLAERSLVKIDQAESPDRAKPVHPISSSVRPTATAARN